MRNAIRFQKLRHRCVPLWVRDGHVCVSPGLDGEAERVVAVSPAVAAAIERLVGSATVLELEVIRSSSGALEAVELLRPPEVVAQLP